MVEPACVLLDRYDRFVTHRMLTHLISNLNAPQVVGRLIGAESGAQAGVEENQPNGFVAPDVLVAVGVGLDVEGLLQQGFVVARIGEGSEVFHREV